MAWIDPTNYWTDRDESPHKKRRTDKETMQAARKKARPPARAAVNENVGAKQQRAPRVNDKALHPYTGALASRLHQHVAHFAVPSHSKAPPKCALHR